MDAIIRAAVVSDQPRQLRRASAAATVVADPVASGLAVTPVAAVTPLAKPAGMFNLTAPSPAAPATAAPASPTVNANSAVPAPPADAVNPAAVAAAAAQDKKVLDADLARVRERERELTAALADAERRGLAIGTEKGEAAALALVQSQAERFTTMTAQLAQARARLLDEAEDQLVDIAFAAICRIIGDNAASRATLTRIVHDLVGAAREPANIRVRLHPDDLAQLRGEDGAAANGIDTQITLAADPAIVLGGCIVDSANGTLDASLDLQLANLRATLLSVRAQRRNSDEAL